MSKTTFLINNRAISLLNYSTKYFSNFLQFWSLPLGNNVLFCHLLSACICKNLFIRKLSRTWQTFGGESVECNIGHNVIFLTHQKCSTFKRFFLCRKISKKYQKILCYLFYNEILSELFGTMLYILVYKHVSSFLVYCFF